MPGQISAETGVVAQGLPRVGRSGASAGVESPSAGWIAALEAGRGFSAAGLAGSQARLVRGVGRAGEAETPGEARVDEQRDRDEAARDAAEAEASAGVAEGSGDVAGAAQGERGKPEAARDGSNDAARSSRGDGGAARDGVVQRATDDAVEPATVERALKPREGGRNQPQTTASDAPRADSGASGAGDARMIAGQAGRSTPAAPVATGSERVALRASQISKPIANDALTKLVAIGNERRGAVDLVKQKLTRLAASQQPTLSAAEEEAVLGQVTRGLASVLRKGGGSMTLRLRPEALGSVRVDLTFADAGVRARVEASDEAARQLLLGRVGELRSALESRGLAVDDVRVELAPWDGGAGTDRGGGRGDGTRGGDRHAGEGPGMGVGEGEAGAGESATDGAGGGDSMPGGMPPDRSAVSGAPEARVGAAGDAATERGAGTGGDSLVMRLDLVA